MKKQKLPCEICDREVPIRSTIKTGDNKGKKACPICKHKCDGEPTPKAKLKRQKSKTAIRRKKEREDFPEFFHQAITGLKHRPWCQNCGAKINTNYKPHHNIAHILPKSRYKSVATHPDNKLFLCASKDDQNSCHEKFDGGFSNMMKMKVFPLAAEKFKKFREKVTENGKLFHILDDYNQQNDDL